MLPRGTGVSAGKALHRKGTGENGETGARATRQVHRDGATATGIGERIGIATDKSHYRRVGFRQHPTAATRASGAGDTLPRARTHPATDQIVVTERSHHAAGTTHQQRPTPATTPNTALSPPSRPTPGRSRKTPRLGRPDGGGPAGRAPAPRQAPGRARRGARAATSRPSTSTRRVRRPSRSWTS